MKAIDRFCYKHPKLGIPDLMKYIVLANAAVFVLDLFTNSFFSNLLFFHYNSIMHGQVWRLLTFILVPSIGGAGSVGFGLMTNVFFFAMTSFFYYSIGTTLERYMGSTKFTVFYALGVLLNMLLGLLTHASVNMYYINMSMFFSFATLYPDMRVLLYGIIPLKVKWLALIDVALFAVDVLGALLRLDFIGALLPIIALANFLVFFWNDMARAFGFQRQKVRHQHSHQTIQFKAAAKQQRQKEAQQGYRHKCAVCGRTDTAYPDLQFRYCSRCAGYHCFCEDHIFNHEHFTQ